MLTLLLTKLNRPRVEELRSIFRLAMAEAALFDAPMIAVLIVMWRGV